MSFCDIAGHVGHFENYHLLQLSYLTHWGRDKWPPFRRRHFQAHFLERKCQNLIKISLNFVPMSPFDNIPALFQIMAWRRPGDKPLSEAMIVSLPTHICVTRPQWVNIADGKLNLERNMYNLIDIAVPADVPAPGGAGTSAGTACLLS